MVDACIVGAGASGAVVAHTLASAGLTVQILEAGAEFVPGDNLNRGDREWQKCGVIRANGVVEHIGIPWTASGLGGGTSLYAGIMFRLRETDFHPPFGLDLTGGLSSAWPLSYADLRPFYDEVERRLGIARLSGADPTEPPSAPAVLPPHPPSKQGALIAAAAANLGMTPFPTPLAVNTEPFGGRPRCEPCGPCNEHYCTSGARVDAFRWLLNDDARARLPISVRTRARVLRIRNISPTRVAAVEWLDEEFRRRSVTLARCVIVAANAVQSCALLLRSRGPHAPAGLGNAHDLLGRGLSLKVSGSVSGWVPAPAAMAIRGPHSTVAISDHYRDGDLPFGMGGMIYEATPDLPARDGLMPLRLHVIAGDIPSARNRIRLLNTTDAFGAPDIGWEYATNPADAIRLDRLLARAEAVLRAAGAQGIRREETPYEVGSRHLHGTCRSSQDPQSGVVDADGRVHGMDNLFVADGGFFPFSGGVNPTFTIMANALRISRRLAAELTGPRPVTPTNDPRPSEEEGSA